MLYWYSSLFGMRKTCLSLVISICLYLYNIKTICVQYHMLKAHRTPLQNPLEHSPIPSSKVATCTHYLGTAVGNVQRDVLNNSPRRRPSHGIPEPEQEAERRLLG